MKRLVGISIFFITIFNLTSGVLAYTFPNEFWSANAKYEEALNNNNYSDIIRYGNEIVNIMDGSPNGAEKTDILVTRYNQIVWLMQSLGIMKTAQLPLRSCVLMLYPMK